MKTFGKLFLVIPGIFTTLCFTSCFYGFKSAVSVTQVNQFKNDSIEYFREVTLYEGICTLPDSAYTLIAKIKIEGKEGASENDLLEMLRKEAFKRGANAVIEVNVSTEERERGSGLFTFLALFDNSGGYEPDVYNAIVVNGVAVYIKD